MKRSGWFIAMASLWLTGCDKELDFSGFNRSPEIIVDGHFSTDSAFTVKIGLSSDIMAPNGFNPAVGDAQVNILDSSGNVFQLLHQGNGKYMNPSLPIAGMPYQLVIKTADGKIIKAQDKIPVDSIVATVDTITGPENRLDIKMNLTDPVKSENRYILRLLEFSTHYIYDDELNVIDSSIGWFPIPIVSSNNIFEISNSIRGNKLNFEMFEDEFFDGQQYQINLLIDRSLLEKGEMKNASTALKVYLKSVNTPCYEYYLGIIKNSKNYGGPFSTNFNPEDNVENGLGIFSGYRFYEKVITLK